MNKLLAPCVALAFATALAHAGPADDAAAAAKKLAAAPNYSWSRTTEIANSQFPVTPLEGMTEKGGYTLTKMTFNENTFQTVSKGDKSVSQGQDGTWLTAEERREQFAARSGGGGGGGGGGRGRGGFGMFGGGAQVSPADDAASMAAKLKDAKMEDGVIVGTLSATDAAALLTFGRGGRGGGEAPPPPKNASGIAKFWVKDGALVKYAVTVKGTVSIPNGEEREVERTTTTEFKNVGSTKVTVPEEAKKKLGA